MPGRQDARSPRLALVVQRYGEEVVGGAERMARLLAERLAPCYDVSVLTTCAQDYRTWANKFPAGEQVINNVRVLRWPVERKRRWTRFGWKSRSLFSRRLLLDNPKPDLSLFAPGVSSTGHFPYGLGSVYGRGHQAVLAEHKWIIEQGPVCAALIEYLEEHRDRFDLFLFFTYLYYPTFFGVPAVAGKSILVPAAHDEPAIHLSIFRSLFHLPRYLVFNTEEEQDFVHALFHNAYIPHKVIGVGVDLHAISSQDDGYLLYAGRIEAGKNCEEMFEFSRKSGTPLKVIGQAQMPVPNSVQYLGFVSEEEKEKLFARCKAVVMPSKNESLSIALLEAWAHGKPVIVSAESPVLSAQVYKSGGGYTYSGLEEFQRIVKQVDAGRGKAGRNYVEQNYSWDMVLKKYEEVFSFFSQE